MGQRIWALLDEYAGQWVTLDKSGRVIDCAQTLTDLRQRAGEDIHRLSFVFAAVRCADTFASNTLEETSEKTAGLKQSSTEKVFENLLRII